MELPLVTILIITWNRKKEILESVQSIYEQRYPNYEIIVVDNGSEDDTVAALGHAHPDVRIIPLDRNMGVSIGRNAGIAVAQGEIILCLDSDASLAPDSLTNLVRRFQVEPEIGVINSKIVNAYPLEQDCGPGWAYPEEIRGNQDEEFLSWSFSEGGAAIRREVFDKVGLFWELIFFGCEGQEFSLRVWDAGYKVLYYPKSIVHHRASSQQRVIGKSRDCLLFKNTLSIYIARYPLWMLALLGPLKVAAVMARAMRRGYLLEVLRALFDVAKALPVLLRCRKPIRSYTARIYFKLLRRNGPLSWTLSSWIKQKI